MPTTIQFVPRANIVSRSKAIGHDSSDARVDLFALLLWAVVMLSISAAIQFGRQPLELGEFQSIGLF